jgi:glutamyl-tRNA reductase
LFLIDIAVPRDIAADAQQVENVFLYNMDHLEQLMRENVKLREQEVARCQEIIGQHAATLMAKIQSAPSALRMAGQTPQPSWMVCELARN